MNYLRKIKIGVKTASIGISDFMKGHTFKFAKKDGSKIAFNHAIELTQEIKKTETIVNKRYNLNIACDKIEEYVILPGQIFSFWKAVGNPDKIFRKGRTIINGRIHEEVGGGICQVSGIIYHVSIVAGLEILERHNHSVDIYTEETRFTPLGTDAAVVYRYKDLRIRNHFSFPVKFEFAITENSLSIKLLSQEKIEKTKLFYDIQPSNHDKFVTVMNDDQKIINQSLYKNI